MRTVRTASSKEGVAVAFENIRRLAGSGLLRFHLDPWTGCGEEVSSLAEYVERMKEGQEDIYYLVGPDRETLENGPYVEAFKQRGFEVCYFTDQVDDYVLETLREYGGKKLVSADRSGIDLEDQPSEGEALDEKDAATLVEWMKKTLADKVEDVTAGQRLVSHPLVALTPEDAPGGQMRAMMEAMGQDAPEVKAKLEINPRHDLIKNLFALQQEKEELAAQVVNQLTDNALLAAGLKKNPASVVSGMNELVGALLK